MNFLCVLYGTVLNGEEHAVRAVGVSTTVVRTVSAMLHNPCSFLLFNAPAILPRKDIASGKVMFTFKSALE
jgi:hypothetical protein